MEYLHVLSRPKVIDQEHDTVWTEAYIDSTVSSPRRPTLTSQNPAKYQPQPRLNWHFYSFTVHSGVGKFKNWEESDGILKR